MPISTTETNNRTRWILYGLLTLLLTALNACKPVVVDDTAYLAHARQIATDPWHPYAFEIFWNDTPQSGMSLLLPPLLPYWLAGASQIVGWNLIALKLSLWPFLILLVWAVDELLSRWAKPVRFLGSCTLLVSPVVLPLWNFMLDVPAVALALGAVAAWFRAVDGPRKDLWAILSGLLIALALQTKYSVLALPLVILWWGFTIQRLRFALGICLIGLFGFAAWEALIIYQEGASHFFVHVRGQSSAGVESGQPAWSSILQQQLQKFQAVLPLVTLSGTLLGWMIPWCWRSLFPDSLSPRVVLMISLGLATTVIVASSTTWGEVVLLRRADGSPQMTGQLFVASLLGWTWLGSLGLMLLARLWQKGWYSWRVASEDAWWVGLAGWWTLELLAYFILTPFPASRRLIPLACVSQIGLIMTLGNRGIGVSTGLVFAPALLSLWIWSVDVYDAGVERDLVRQIDSQPLQQSQPLPTTWTIGHWGWQYYAERAGWKLVIPGRTEFQTGDRLVVPVDPTGSPLSSGFYRPFHGGAVFETTPQAWRFEQRIVADDPWPATTIPALYSGGFPVAPRRGPRLVVDVWRAVKPSRAHRPESFPQDR